MTIIFCKTDETIPQKKCRKSQLVCLPDHIWNYISATPADDFKIQLFIEYTKIYFFLDIRIKKNLRLNLMCQKLKVQGCFLFIFYNRNFKFKTPTIEWFFFLEYYLKFIILAPNYFSHCHINNKKWSTRQRKMKKFKYRIV